MGMLLNKHMMAFIIWIVSKDRLLAATGTRSRTDGLHPFHMEWCFSWYSAALVKDWGLVC